MSSRRERPPIPALAAILGALAALATAVLWTRHQLQRDLHRQLAAREGRGLAALFEGRLAALRAEGVDDPLVAAIDVASLPQFGAVPAITLFDAEGLFPSRLVGKEPVPPPPAEAVAAARSAGPTTTYLPGPAPLLRVYAPLREETGQGLVGILGIEIPAEALAEEYRTMDLGIARQSLLTLVLAGAATAGAVGFAFARLARANALLAERSERLRRANRELSLAARTGAVGAVASHLVHGLRNPLAGLQSFVAGLGAGEAAGERLADAEATARRMRGMIDEVVRVLRSEDGVHAFEIPADELLGMAARRIAATAAAAGVDVRVECGSRRELPNRDANLLLLIMENLLTNAVQHSPRGGRVRLACDAPPGGPLSIRVTDSGTGIPDALRPGLFQPTTSTRPGGSGLGLAITRRLAASIGAAVELESTGPSGTTFRVTLPPEAAGANPAGVTP